MTGVGFYSWPAPYKERTFGRIGIVSRVVATSRCGSYQNLSRFESLNVSTVVDSIYFFLWPSGVLRKSRSGFIILLPFAWDSGRLVSALGWSRIGWMKISPARKCRFCPRQSRNAMGGRGPNRNGAVHGCYYFLLGAVGVFAGHGRLTFVGMSRGCQGCELLASRIKSAVRSVAVIYSGLPKARI